MKKKTKKDPYKVRTVTKAVKDVDLSERTVTGIFNSAYFIDSDMDMLLPGAATKSIQERGVDSTKGNKIKHLKDHDWSKNIARLDVLEERTVEINGREVSGIYHESFYPEASDSTDMLIKIQEGLYDARSIGFQYVNLDYLEEGDEDFERYVSLAINPEVATEAGYLWVVKEIKLWEGSDVSFGANQLTPLLGVKSEGSKDVLIDQLYQKIDICTGLCKSGKLSDDGFHRLEMEMQQIKSYIAAVAEQKPSKKSTQQEPGRDPKDTNTATGFDFLKNL